MTSLRPQIICSTHWNYTTIIAGATPARESRSKRLEIQENNSRIQQVSRVYFFVILSSTNRRKSERWIKISVLSRRTEIDGKESDDDKYPTRWRQNPSAKLENSANGHISRRRSPSCSGNTNNYLPFFGTYKNGTILIFRLRRTIK